MERSDWLAARLHGRVTLRSALADAGAPSAMIAGTRLMLRPLAGFWALVTEVWLLQREGPSLVFELIDRFSWTKLDAWGMRLGFYSVPVLMWATITASISWMLESFVPVSKYQQIIPWKSLSRIAMYSWP